MSKLENLAPELLLIVLEESPGLASLYNLICASPRAKAIFDTSSTRLVNKLISETLPEELHRCPRLVAIMDSIRSQQSPYAASTLHEFLNSYSAIVGAQKCTKDVPALLQGLANSPGTRRTLLAANRVEILGDVCLSKMMARLHGHQNGPTGFLHEDSNSPAMPLILIPH